MAETIPDPPICAECGGTLVPFEEGSVMGWRCTSCDFSIVATNIKPIDEDPQRYDLHLVATPAPRLEAMKFVSSKTGMNYIQAKEAIREGERVETKLYANDALALIREFERHGVGVRTTPPFPWVDETTRRDQP